MDIREFFDIDKIDHVRAYQHLKETGCWPQGFIPEGTMFESGSWHADLAMRLANKYVERILDWRKSIKRVWSDEVECDDSEISFDINSVDAIFKELWKSF